MHHPKFTHSSPIYTSMASLIHANIVPTLMHHGASLIHTSMASTFQTIKMTFESCYPQSPAIARSVWFPVTHECAVSHSHESCHKCTRLVTYGRVRSCINEPCHVRQSQHSATHCSAHCNTLQRTLQHTATHTATHCNAHCNTLQRTLQHTTTAQCISVHVTYDRVMAYI